MRTKEEEDDYRYFPDPDIVPIEISDNWIDRLRSSLPEFRDEKIIRYQKEYGISKYDAEVITSSVEMAKLFEDTTKLCDLPKEAANWLMVEGMRLLNENNIDACDICITPERLSKLILMVEQGRVNRIKAKEVFEKSFLENIDPEEYVKNHRLEMISDASVIRLAAMKVLEDNPGAVSDYKNGKKKAFGNLVGQTIKAMDHKADPAIVNAIIKELLE